MRFALSVLELTAFLAPSPPALAQEDDPTAPSLPQDAPDELDPEVTDETEPEKTENERLIELEDKIVDLEQRLRQVEEQKKSPITIGGYADFGFFAPIGDGPG